MGPVEQIESKAKTGIWGLDNILSGGFSRGHLFVQRAFGTGEKYLDLTLLEADYELRDREASHGWTLGGGIDVFGLPPPESLLSEQQQDLLYSSDLELEAAPLPDGQGQ